MKEYYRAANEIQARQNGLVDDDVPAQTAQQPVAPQTTPDSLQLPSLSLPQK